jgi:hypothetical protein
MYFKVLRSKTPAFIIQLYNNNGIAAKPKHLPVNINNGPDRQRRIVDAAIFLTTSKREVASARCTNHTINADRTGRTRSVVGLLPSSFGFRSTIVVVVVTTTSQFSGKDLQTRLEFILDVSERNKFLQSPSAPPRVQQHETTIFGPKLPVGRRSTYNIGRSFRYSHSSVDEGLSL